MSENYLIKVKRGPKSQLPTLDLAEFGFCTNTNELYIGNNGNVLINGGNGEQISNSIPGEIKAIYGATLGGSDGYRLITSDGILKENWAVCNGLNGTLDLSQKFILGTSNSEDVGLTGGASTITLTTAQIPGHTHIITGSTSSAGAHTHTVSATSGEVSTTTGTGRSLMPRNATSTSSTSSTGAHTHTVTSTAASTGGGASHNNMPPYFTLMYFMYIGDDV